MKIREDRTIWTASKLMNRRQVIKRTALLSGRMVLLKHSLGDQTQPGGDGRSFWPQCLGYRGDPREWIYGYYFPHPYAKKFNNSNNHPEVRYARDQSYKLYDNGDLYDTQIDHEKVRGIYQSK
tara:strand:+ start:8606 stop:8974 length:369 start_codon:yes stop_codon:yes gene_type:complete